MSDFNEHYNQSLRLALLRLLSEAPKFSANSAVLQSAATSMAFHVSRDKINGQLDWLAEQDLLKIEDLGNVKIASLTQRGHDVSQGLAIVTGVDRPSPSLRA